MITYYTQFFETEKTTMGTHKSVCSSWSGLISRDIYEHTHMHLRLWMMSEFDTFRWGLKEIDMKKLL